MGSTVPAREARRVVTILFSDLKGSTSLGEQLDSESLREVMSRYFDVMRDVIEGHGGTVEKFIGDAVMAVFGLPTVNEDDALRAVQAAGEMRTALRTLNVELQDHWGVTLANRTGVNTGEVVTGDPSRGQRLVTGDAVNVAARLEQAAPATEVLIGDLTYRLVRDHVEVEAVEPLELKGKSERVPAYRLVTVGQAERVPRGRDRPIVGRAEEMALLNEALGEARTQERCRLVTLLGEPGIGKSRLVDEFVAAATEEEAAVLRGRCLPYGRGITFWPLVEMVREAAGIEEEDTTDVACAKLARVAGDESGEMTDRVAATVGLTTTGFSLDETFWGVRKLFEALAAQRPLVLVFEDIHWAEQTFLDLVRHIADSATGPILLLALARQQLLEVRPDWSEAPDARQIALDPLAEADIAQMVEALLGAEEELEQVRSRILAAAQGNPLFVEQMLSMMIDEGALRYSDGQWHPVGDVAAMAVPPTMQALLAARLDRLVADERAVIEPASVIGVTFARAAVEQLVPYTVYSATGKHLTEMCGKQLLRPEPALGVDEAFRFDHVLIRDAAYHGLLKRERATLHERFVDWAERVNRERERGSEFEEILGYHLEQAYRYRSELGTLDEQALDLGARAARRLAGAGRRAFARGDMPAAANLLRRAANLLPARDPARLELLPDLGEALTDIGEFAWAQVFLEEAAEAATELGDDRLRAHAVLARLMLEGQSTEAERWSERVVSDAEAVIPVLEAAKDEAGLATAYRVIAWAHGTACRYERAAAAAESALEHAVAARDDRQQRRAASQYAITALYGPTPVPEAIEQCELIIEQVAGDRRSEGLVTSLLARLEAMRGDFDQARTLYTQARATLEDMGRSVIASSTSLDSCGVEMLAGDPAAAERELRRDYAALEEMGETYLLSTLASELARALVAQGRADEAQGFTQTAEELTAEDDLASQALWRSMRARVLAGRGQLAEACALGQQAVDLLRQTDASVTQADALVDLAEVQRLAGRPVEARASLQEAARLFERKGNVVSARKTDALLRELTDERAVAGA